MAAPSCPAWTFSRCYNTRSRHASSSRTMAHPITDSELRAIQRFPGAAKQFCDLIENASDHSRKQFVDQAFLYLCDLCSIGIQLPDVEPATAGVDHSDEEIKRHAEESRNLYNILKEKLGDLDTYWAVFDPTKQGQSVPNSLSTDLAEIYLDLKGALELHTSDTHIDDIHWEWRAAYLQHWSRHAVESLKVTLFISVRA